MATSRKGSTTPKELKEDAGGLVAGGGPDLSGTAAQPAQPVARPRSRAAGTGTGTSTSTSTSTSTGTKKAPAEQQPGAAPTPKPRAKPATKAAAKSSAAPTASAGAVGAGPGEAGAQTDGILPPAPGAQATDPDGRMSDEERQRRIAERAYLKAQERGFAGDRQLDDWLEAEREHNEAEGRPG
jgi:hypothetical protein